MDAYANYSMLAMVTAAVIYLFALFAHAAEWAAGRHAGTRVERRTGRVPVVVGAGRGAEGRGVQEPGLGHPDREGHRGGELEEGVGGGSAGDGAGVLSEPTDAKQRTDLFGRIGIALTVIGLLTHIAGVVLRGLAAGRLPWGNMYEFTTTSLIFLVAAYLVLATRHRQRWLGLPVSMLATIGLGLAVTVFYVGVAPLVPSLHSAWFAFHILAATIAGAAFTISGVSAILSLIRRRAEASGVVRGYLAKVPSADKLDRFTYVAAAFAFPLFTFVIAAGAIWAQYAWGRYWGWDPKETWSLITWAIYAAYLHARSTAGWKGRPAAIIAVVGAVSFWWNFVGINLLVSGLHSYAK